MKVPYTILVVDDEQAIADTMRLLLVRHGYDVTAVYSAAQALEVLRATRVDLLVADVVMPEMNGFDLAVQTRRSYPQTRILLMSGNAATQDIASGANERFELLAKPVFPKQMLEHVARMLAEPSAGASSV